MAILKNNFLRGVIGPVIFKKYNGEQHVVSKIKPGTMRQTENTKKAQGTFGMGSSLGSAIRETLESDIYGFLIPICIIGWLAHFSVV